MRIYMDYEIDCCFCRLNVYGFGIEKQLET